MSFYLDLKKFGDKAERLMTIIPRKVALEVFSRVVMRTPVDTGRARGNWQANVGSPAAGVVEATDTGGSDTVMEIANEVESWDVENVAIYLVNNLPYIVALEDGWSDQAPAGMVKVSLAEFPEIVEAMTRETP